MSTLPAGLSTNHPAGRCRWVVHARKAKAGALLVLRDQLVVFLSAQGALHKGFELARRQAKLARDLPEERLPDLSARSVTDHCRPNHNSAGAHLEPDVAALPVLFGPHFGA